MSSPFAAPGTISGLDFETLLGRLLLITPVKQEFHVKTNFGPKDPIRADVIVLDGPDAGTEHNDTLIFPSLLIEQLRSRIGQKVLGRLNQGVAKPGQKPPWRLDEATEADQKIGLSWLNKNALAKPAPAGDTPPWEK